MITMQMVTAAGRVSGLSTPLPIQMSGSRAFRSVDIGSAIQELSAMKRKNRNHNPSAIAPETSSALSHNSTVRSRSEIETDEAVVGDTGVACKRQVDIIRSRIPTLIACAVVPTYTRNSTAQGVRRNVGAERLNHI